MRGKLTARGIPSAGPGHHNDGGGLYLSVAPDGNSRSWVFRYRVDGRLREHGLGATHTISLVEAREAALQCRKLRYAGIDPIEARRERRMAAKLDAATAMTFRQCAEAYIAAQAPGWRQPKSEAQWRQSLMDYVFPVFGALPVKAINVGLVMRVLEPIWPVKTETASRVRGRIEAILDWATARAYRQGENPARWRGHLENLLPQKTRVARVQHHAVLPYPEIAPFMAQLRQQDGTAACALEFAILSAARAGETIGAQWGELNLAERVWIIPASRMKGGREHRVPLSDAAMAVVEKMAEIRSGDFSISGWPCWARPYQHGPLGRAETHGPSRSDRTRLPIELPRLGRRAHQLPGRGCRDGAGARCRRQG